MGDSPLERGGAPQEDLERVAHHLRGMRSGLEQYSYGHRSSWPDAKQRWKALLDRYDAALVEASIMLGQPLSGGQLSASGAVPGLSEEERNALERSLRDAGLDL